MDKVYRKSHYGNNPPPLNKQRDITTHRAVTENHWKIGGDVSKILQDRLDYIDIDENV